MKRWLSLAACLVLGCGGKPLQFSEPGKAMVQRFEAQLPQHKTAAFKQMCEELDRMHKDGKVSDEEYEALHRVCGQAKEGQWDRAASSLKPLSEALKAKQSEPAKTSGEKQ